MSQYLLSTTVKYRVETEEQAKELIEEIKKTTPGDVVKYDCVYKNQKAKGEIIQEWFEVSIATKFNDPKDAYNIINIEYEVG